MVEVKVKRVHPDAEIPQYKTAGAVGLDLCALEEVMVVRGEVTRVRTGIALELPSGYEGQIRPRSGMAFDSQIVPVNTPGTIDSDYRGEVIVGLTMLWGPTYSPFLVKPRMRIAQLVIVPAPQVRLVEVAELTSTARGAGGFGSTGAI